jgi:hypothetical protein
MAFESASTGYQQIEPTFAPGYPYENRYHNLGQLTTPYQGKRMGVGGDYAPPQRTRYYTSHNPTYPYVLDANFHAEEYLPTEKGCCFSRPGYFSCYNPSYPDVYVPSNYFAPQLQHPSGKAPPDRDFGRMMYTGMVVPVDSEDALRTSLQGPPGFERKFISEEEKRFRDKPLRENYSGSFGGTSGTGSSYLYRSITTAPQARLVNDKSFYPFGNQRYY